MATVTIKAINRQNVLSSEQFAYILQNLHKPLLLHDISWFRDGSVCCISVFWHNRIIVLFPSTNGIEYEVRL